MTAPVLVCAWCHEPVVFSALLDDWVCPICRGSDVREKAEREPD